MSPSTRSRTRRHIDQPEGIPLETEAPPRTGFNKLVEVLTHPRLPEYIHDELTARAIAALREQGLDGDPLVRTFIEDIAYSSGYWPEAINLLKLAIVQRCFVDLVIDHSLPHYDVLQAQYTRWYSNALEYRLGHGRWRVLESAG